MEVSIHHLNIDTIKSDGTDSLRTNWVSIREGSSEITIFMPSREDADKLASVMAQILKLPDQAEQSEQPQETQKAPDEIPF